MIAGQSLLARMLEGNTAQTDDCLQGSGVFFFWRYHASLGVQFRLIFSSCLSLASRSNDDWTLRQIFIPHAPWGCVAARHQLTDRQLLVAKGGETDLFKAAEDIWTKQASEGFVQSASERLTLESCHRYREQARFSTSLRTIRV